MRTTLDLDEDVLRAAREIARQRGVSLGKVISDLARQPLTRKMAPSSRSGFPLLPVQPGAGIVTLEMVNQLRAESA